MADATTDARLLHRISRSGGISRSELASAFGLPSPTVTSAVRRLLESGDVEEREHLGPRAVAGRRPRLLHVAGPTPVIGVISWGLTGLTSYVADYSGTVLHSHPSASPRQSADPMMFASAISGLRAAAKRLRPATRLTAVVVSVPAPFQQGVGSPGQRLSVSPGETPSPTFYGGMFGDPAQALRERFGFDVYFENNANLAAFGEFAFGAGRGQGDQMFVLLGGNSIGTGLVIGGRLVRGVTGYAGELAHVQVDENGPLCACGGRGCLSNRLGSGLLDSVQNAYEQPVTFDDILAMAARGDPGPGRILSDLGRVIGRPIADVCTVLNPGLVIVDGRLGPAAALVADGMREQIVRYTPPVIGRSVRVVPGELTDAIAVYGAIQLTREYP